MDVFTGQVFQVDAVHRNTAAVDLVKPHQQVDKGGLACTGRADDGDLFAGMDFLRKVVDNDPVRGIAEFDMLEADLTGRVGQTFGLIALVFHLFRFEEIEDTSRCSGSRLDIGHRLRDLGEGSREQADIDPKRDDDTKRNIAVHRQQRADDADRHIPQIADKAHNRHHQAGQETAISSSPDTVCH